MGHLRAGLCAMRRAGLEIARASTVYESEYVGDDHGPQPPFLNCVVEVRTCLDAEALLAICQHVESVRGRSATQGWQPRTLDLDILLYDSIALTSPELTVPHPRMWQRAFVLVPLAELLPWLRSSDGRSARDVASQLLSSGQRLAPYADAGVFTDILSPP